MPTWRPSMMADDVQSLMNEFDTLLTDDEILYVKLHPLADSVLNYSGFKHIRKAPGKFETYEFLSTADCLITDYSSVFFDFAVTGQNIVLFTYDEKEHPVFRIQLPQLDLVNNMTIRTS